MEELIIAKFKEVTPENAFEVIRQVCQHTPSYEDAMLIIDRIAAGADGIAGTSDDIMSQETLECLKLMAKQKIVEQLAKDMYKEVEVSCACLK